MSKMVTDRKLINLFLKDIPNNFYREKTGALRQQANLVKFAKELFFMKAECKESSIKELSENLIMRAMDFVFHTYFTRQNTDVDIQITLKNKMSAEITDWLQTARIKHPFYAINLDDAYRVVKEEQRELCLALVFEGRERQLAECYDLISVCVRFIQREWKNAGSEGVANE